MLKRHCRRSSSVPIRWENGSGVDAKVKWMNAGILHCFLCMTSMNNVICIYKFVCSISTTFAYEKNYQRRTEMHQLDTEQLKLFFVCSAFIVLIYDRQERDFVM